MAVIFDMDGVILDSEQLVVQCWQKIAGKYNIDNIEKFCIAALGLNREAAKKLFVQMYDGRYGDEKRYEILKSEMSAAFHKAASEGELTLKPDVKDTLKSLTDGGIPCALATSTRREVVIPELTNLGVIEYFDKLICGDMVARSKPAPDIFLKACEELNVIPQDTYAVEDSYNGVRSAHAAGMKVIMIPDLVQPDEEIRGKTTYIFTRISDIKKILL